MESQKELVTKIKDVFTDAIRFWESGRIIYNIILTVIFLTIFIMGEKTSHIDFFRLSMILLYLAVIANVLYCATYFIDVFVQFSAYQESWKKYRYLLLIFGILLASFMTWSISQNLVNTF